MKMKNLLLLIISVFSCLLIGALGGIATTSEINDWYVTLAKPSFNPPNYLFGPVWTILYALMGVSFYLILKAEKSLNKRKAILVFCVQLFLNFCWSFLFFKFHLICLALIEIICIWISILAMIFIFNKVNKISSYLQITYLLWVSFAAFLNASIFYLNN